MADFDWVTARIAVGGSIDSLYDVRKIAAEGITHVLNVRTDQDEVPYVLKVGLQYAANPTKKKDEKVKPPGWFKSSFDVIFGALADPGTRILVHCENGENRSASTVYFFLRAVGIDKKTAKNIITDGRPKATMDWNVDAEIALKALGFA
jgi:protein tyrosine phosphatase (PTP) superfamily phosphohydrolase (DUF442 family)